MVALALSARPRWIALLTILPTLILALPSERAEAQQAPTSRPGPPLQLPRGRDPRAISPDPSKLSPNAGVPLPPRGGTVQDMMRRSAAATTQPANQRMDPMEPQDPVLRRQEMEAEPLLSDFPGPQLADGVFPRNSALGWWEVNGETYLRAARESRLAPIEYMTASQTVNQAILRALGSRYTAVRAEAILAAGMMRLTEALQTLELLTQDPEPMCALRAWAAIGLIDSLESSLFLKAPPSTQHQDRVGWAMAVGLLSQPTDVMWEEIRKQVINDQIHVEARQMAIWAIRTHKTPQRHGLLQDVIWNLTDVNLVCEAIRGLPEDRDEQDILFLNNLAQGIGDSLKLPVLARFGVNPSGFAGAIRAFPDLIDISTGRINTGMGDQALTAAAAKAAFLQLRQSAVHALSLCDPPGDSARTLIAAPLDLHIRFDANSGASRAPRGDSLNVLALGRIGNFDDYPTLLDRFQFSNIRAAPGGRRGPAIGPYGNINDFARGRILTSDDLEQYRDMQQRQAQLHMDLIDRELPSRGFAATGIGLMWKKNSDMIVLAFRPNGDLLTAPHEALMQCYQMPTEPIELRASCAIAMGISNTKERARDIKRTMTLLKPGEEVIFGYGVFALGMFGDEEAVQCALPQLGPLRKLLDVSGLVALHTGAKLPIMPLTQVVARRAAAQGLAALGDPDAIPLLVGQWGKDPAINRELARAILWCHRASATAASDDLAVRFGQSLAQLVDNDSAPSLAASAVASIGILHQKKDADRLYQLIVESNFRRVGITLAAQAVDGRPVRSPSLLRHAYAIDNPFYYLYGTQDWEQFLPKQPPARAR